MKEIIVECKTKEEWDKVQEKMFSEGFQWQGGEREGVIMIFDCIRVNEYEKMSMLHKETAEMGYPETPIIPAQEYLQEPRKKAYYECLKCKRKSGIVHLDKKCPFCEKNENQPFEDKSEYFVVVNREGYVGDVMEIGDVVRIVRDGTLSADFETIGKNNGTWCLNKYNVRPATQSEIDAVLGLNKLEKNNMSGDYFSNGGEYLSPSQSKPINQSIIKKTMNNLTNFIKNATLSAEEKLLRENGLKDSCGNYTEAYENVRDFLLNQEYEAKVVEQLKKKLEAEKEK